MRSISMSWWVYVIGGVTGAGKSSSGMMGEGLSPNLVANEGLMLETNEATSMSGLMGSDGTP